MKKQYQWLLLWLLFCFNNALQAQQIYPQQDFGTWIGLKFVHDLPKGIEWSLEQQVRMRRWVTQVEEYWAEVGIAYTINKNFKLAGDFRYIHDVHQWKGSLNSLRYNLDLHLRIPLPNQWRLSYRVRYQQKFINVLKQTQTVIALRNNTVRHRLKVRWKVHKVHQLYGSAELFVRTNPFTKVSLHRFRGSVGDKITTKVGQFNTAIGYAVNLAPNDAFSYFFLKIIYQINL